MSFVAEYPEENSSVMAFATMPPSLSGQVTDKQLCRLIRGALVDMEEYKDTKVPERVLSDEIRASLEASVADMGPEELKDRKSMHVASGWTSYGLRNGFKVCARKTDFQAKRVTVRLSTLGSAGLELPSERGATEIGLSVWVNGGTKDHDASVMQKYLSLHQLTMGANSSGEHMDVVVTVGLASEDTMERAFELIHAYLTRPAMDERALARHVSAAILQRDKIFKDITQRTILECNRWLCCEDPRLQTPLESDYTALTIEKLRSAVLANFRPSNMDISVVGDFDEEELERCLHIYLGTIENDGLPRPCNYELQMLEESRTVNLFQVDDVEGVCVVMGFPAVNRFGKSCISSLKPDLHGLAPSKITRLIGLASKYYLFMRNSHVFV